MASGSDPFPVISVLGVDVVASAKKGVPAFPARSAALHAHTLPRRART
jgi:hypothetical protein